MPSLSVSSPGLPHHETTCEAFAGAHWKGARMKGVWGRLGDEHVRTMDLSPLRLLGLVCLSACVCVRTMGVFLKMNKQGCSVCLCSWWSRGGVLWSGCCLWCLEQISALMNRERVYSLQIAKNTLRLHERPTWSSLCHDQLVANDRSEPQSSLSIYEVHGILRVVKHSMTLHVTRI